MILIVVLLDYERALKEGSSKVPYLGVMIVGNGGVGKSSLLCGLKKKCLPEDSSSTVMADYQSLKSSTDAKDSSEDLYDSSDDSSKDETPWASGSDTQWREISEKDEYKEMAQLVQDIYEKSKSGECQVEHKKPSKNPKSDTDPSSLSEDVTVYKNRHVKDIVDKVMEYASKPISRERCQETWMRVWDCGGQHVFRTIMPAFVASRSMFVLMFDARQYLKNTCISSTNLNGDVIATQDEHLTTQELLLRWMATIHSALCQKPAPSSGSSSTENGLWEKYPKILLVGTNADDEDVQKNEKSETKIKDSLYAAYKSKPYSRISEGCFIVDNTTAGSNHEDKNYATIRQKIHSMGKELTVDTPLSWILFRKFLTEYSKSKPVVELSEIEEIASACKIPKESVSSVLEFYHDLGVFYHYSHIENLKQKVIADPHWLIKVIGSLFPIEEPLNVGTQQMWNELKEGILLQSLLNEVLMKEEKEFLSASEITSLLEYFLIIAEIKYSEDSFSGKKYFVPAVLKPAKEVPTTDKNIAIPAPPLFLTFSTKYVPPGFFTRFTAVLSRNPMLQIVFSGIMYCNRIQLFYGEEHHSNDKIFITENIDNVKIEINRVSSSSTTSENKSESNFKQCCKELIDIFMSSSQEVLKWFPNIQTNISLQCYNCEIQKQHFANLPLQDSISVILCHEKHDFHFTIEQEFWKSVKVTYLIHIIF